MKSKSKSKIFRNAVGQGGGRRLTHARRKQIQVISQNASTYIRSNWYLYSPDHLGPD